VKPRVLIRPLHPNKMRVNRAKLSIARRLPLPPYRLGFVKLPAGFPRALKGIVWNWWAGREKAVAVAPLPL
jgi:hypothetical protein